MGVTTSLGLGLTSLTFLADSRLLTGFPMRNFVRCYRVSWFITNGWYSPALKSRMRELNKWPPPEKYTTLGFKSPQLSKMSLKLSVILGRRRQQHTVSNIHKLMCSLWRVYLFNIHTYIYIHTYIHTHTHTYIYIYIYVAVCIYKHRQIYAGMHACILCLSVCMYVMYVCMRKPDWLSWTQADAEVNRAILDYCQSMKQQLKDSFSMGLGGRIV